MEKYYHFTSYENLESINEFGLIPKRGGRTRSIGDNRYAIFLSQGIINTILMYVSVLFHYERHSGDLGRNAIEYYKEKIEDYNNLSKKMTLDEEDIIEIKAIKKAIESTKQIMEYNDFFEYLGDGVYLSVSKADNMNKNDLRDCYTTNNIPAENINIIVLKNKFTGEIIVSRESILTYFMSITPIKNIVGNTSNIITKKIVEDLYLNKLEDMKYYNINNFEINEIPLNLYILNTKKDNEINKIR